MKKVVLLFLVLTMIVTAFAGCGGNNNASQSPSASASASASVSPAASASQSAAPSEAASAAVKTGLGSVISIAKSASVTSDKDAFAEIDTIMAAVTLDKDGKIVNVKIDMVQPKVTFDSKGQLTGDIKQEIRTKVEIGDAYGMAKASSIGKEWYQQIAALEDWMTGKTIDEVMGLEVNGEGVTTNADLTSSVTVSVTGYLEAVKKAVANAKDFGATVSGATKTGIGNVTSIAKSTSATADAEAVAQADAIMAAVTVDQNNKIVGVMIDNGQVKVNFDAKGMLTTDTAVAPKTKVELGDEYGMKKASSIGMEWYQEIAALGQWMIGKTIDEVKAMKTAPKDDAHPAVPAEADLTSSVTISVQDFIAAVEKAVATAD